MVAEEIHALRLDLLIRALLELACMTGRLAVVEAVVKCVDRTGAAVRDVVCRGLWVGKAAVGFPAIAELARYKRIGRVADTAVVYSLSV